LTPYLQKKGIKYDITTTEQCPLCEEDIRVGTAGPRGLAQHQGKKKCLATVKKKQEDAKTAKMPTLFSYLRRQDTTLPTTADLAKESERREAESSSRVVVSQLAMSPPMMNAARADQDAQGQGEDADPSTDRDLDSDLDRDLDRAWDRNEPAWSTVRVRARVGGCEPGCEAWARSSMPTLASNNAHTGHGKVHAADNAERPKQKLQATPARKGCRDAWRLLDRLRAGIGKIPCEVLEDGEGSELLNELLGYNNSAALSLCNDVPRDEVWENVNPGLDRILGFGRTQEEIVAMVRHSWVGLQGLYEYLEVLVEEGGVVGGLLEGKVTALIAAMAE
jgi:hypothetical protein